MLELRGKYNTAKVFTDVVEETAISQIINLLNQEFIQGSNVRIMSDVHAGAGCTIGTTMTITDKIVPNLVGVDIGCLDAKTEYLTYYGWKRMDQFTEGDHVLEYDPYNNTAEFVIPNAYIKLPCDKLHTYRNNKGLSMSVSDEHRILVYKGFKGRGYTFEDMSYDFLDTLGLSKGYYNIKTAFEINQIGINKCDDELRLMVAISADARIRNNNVEFHLKKQRKIDRLLLLLSNLNIPYKVYNQGDNSVSINFDNRHWDKDLTWVYKVNKHQAEVVSDESLLWDGHKGYRSHFSSKHKEYVDAIQFAFAARGVRASMNCVSYEQENWADTWVLSPTQNEYVGINAPSYEENTEDGYKYCFNVDTSYFVARRDNHIFITGNCGMEVVQLKEKHIELQKLDKLIYAKIPSGFSVRQKEHRYLDKVNLSDLHCYHCINIDRAEKSLGTLGGGNHFIEANKDEDGNVYIVVHSGSRHLGLEVANHYQEAGYEALNSVSKQDVDALVARLKIEGRQKDINKELKKLKSSSKSSIPKALAYVENELFKQYIHDMKIVQEYAMLNRQAMMDEIIKGMGLHVVDQFTTIHNYIDTENMILRKGAVSAQQEEKLIIPINMRDGSLICVGKGNPDWNYSAPHGAGRLMSRSKAKENFTVSQFKKEMQGIYTTSVNQATLDESPMAYKNMEDIVNNIGDTVDIIKTIKPIYNFKAGEE